ncbi:MAG: hypothetical protein B7Z13_06440 [Caulobacterales bacterium 32-67-6]|nr:MAG: hypothetical protein B7Z13_06440 [Caulobacterales bacterium 32-67-6]
MPNLSWEVMFPIGAALLGLAIAYGLFRYSRRDRRNDSLSEQATREVYQHPERANRTADDLRAKARSPR